MNIYEYNGATFTEEEVIKRAADKGMSLEDYLNKNIEIRLISKGKVQDSTEDPTMSQDIMGSQLDDGSLESQKQDSSWFDQTWFGRGWAAASTTGEATDLILEGSNVDMSTVQEFIKAKETEAREHVPSERMQKFQKQYQKEGSSWTAFFRGVKRDPALMAELFVQSLGTQLGTLADTPAEASTAAALGAGVGAGATWYTGYGAIAGGLAGAMGGLATTMESALTFGELIEEELKEEGKEFTDVNIKALLEGPKGKSIRNKAIGRGLTIGAVEGFTGGVAAKTTTSVLRAGKTAGRTKKLLAGAAGTSVEAVGGGTGEVLGRVAAGQEMDPAEIGFEAITGTVTAPLNVGRALLTHKTPVYTLNKKEVSYAEMKDFVDTADDIDIAKANIKMENDFTGLGQIATKKQNKAIMDSQIDEKITDKKDRDRLVELGEEMNEAEANVKKKGIDKVPDAPETLAKIQAEIDAIIGKYEGAVGIGETQTAQDVAKIVRENRISDTIAFAEAAGKKIGKDVLVVDDNDSAQAAYDKIAEEMGLKAKDVTEGDGFIVGDSIVINKEVAGRKGAISVGSHEILHGILAKHMQGLDIGGKKNLISSFKNVLSKNQLEAVTKRLEDNYVYLRDNDGEFILDEKGQKIKDTDFDIETTDEWFTAFSDAIEKNEITFDEGVFDKIKNLIQEIARKFGIKKDFADGRQAYNFLKDYSASIKKNKLSSRAIALAEGGATVTEGKLSKTAAAAAAMAGDAASYRGTRRALGKEISDDAKRISKTVDDIGRKATTKAEYDAGVNLEAYDYLIDKKGLDGLILAQLMKNNIDVKAEDANVNGVPLEDYMEDVRTKLIPDVLGFNPEMEVTEEGKFGLSGYINQRLIFRMGTVATKAKKTVTGRSLEKPVGTTGKTIADTIEADVDETTKAFEEEDISPAARAKKREAIKIAEKSKAIRKHNVTAQDIKNIKDDVAEGLTDPKLPRIDEFEWTQAFRDKVANKKSPLFKKIQKLVGTGDKFAQTLKDTRKVMFGKEGLPTSDLVQMEKMEKEKIFAELEYRATNQELIDEAVEKGLIKTFEAKTEKQGPGIYNRKYPSEKELLNFFGKYVTKIVKGKEVKVYVPHRGRRESYIINASNFFAQDAIADVLENQPQVYETLVKNNAEKGLPSSKNPVSVIKQRIDRNMDVMFSKSFGDADASHRAIFGRNLDKFNKNLVKYNFNVRRAFEETYPERLFVKGRSKKLRNEIIQDLEKYIGWYQRQDGTEVKPELSLQDYIQLELTSPELTVKDLRQAYNLSKKDIDFSNLDQIVSARVALLKIMQHPKMGKTRVIRFMKSLTEPTQLGNTDAIALSTEQVSTVDQVRETGKLQKKINRKKKQIAALKAKKKLTKEEKTKLQNAEKKLKEYQSPDYKRRPGYGIIEDAADFNKNFVKQLDEDIVAVRDRNTQTPSLIVNKKGVDKAKYNELEKNSEADADFLIDLMDVMRELRAIKGPEGISTNDAAMIHMTLSSGMNTALAAAAKPRYIPYVGKNQMYTGKMRWEHMIPRVIISLYLAEYQNGNISKKDIKFLLDNFHVAALPLHLDTLVTEAGYQAKMHAGWALKDSDGNLSLLTISDIRRYLNMRTFGKWDIPLFDLKEQKVEPRSLIFAEKGANFNPDKIKARKSIDNAVKMSRSTQKESKGITVLDFDDTLATTESLVRYTAPDGTTGTLNAEEYASTYQDLLEQGYTFDFSEFSKVVKGKLAPLFNKALKLQSKFGPDNMFILTARPPAAQKAIFDFLKANGLNIPVKNITGLGNSTAEAKALWIADKVGEGYNDFYFADDALQNVQAVDNILSQFDVKRKIQQAKVKFSLSTKQDLNWKEDSIGYMTTNFDVDGNNYKITLYPTDLNDTNYELEFDLVTEKGLTQEMTGTGNQFEVLGTVYNGLLDVIKQKPNIETIGFSALTKDKSRTKVYTTLMDKLGRKLGWKTDIYEYGSGTQLDFEVAKPKALKTRTKTTESIRNIPAVKNILNQSDIKSSTQQAKVKFSKSMNKDFNDILEDVTGIESKKRFSAVKARKRGESKGKFRFFIPPSHEDFVGLLYNFIGRGKEGNAHRDFFEKALVRPLNRAFRELNTARQSIANDYKSLNKQFENVKKKLNKKTPDGDFTYQDAIRVYLWDKHGYDIPGLTPTDQQNLVDLVMNDTELQTYAETLNVISKREDYIKPSEGWEVTDIRMDLDDATGKVGRKEFFAEFLENAEIIFSPENFNKIEAAYGPDMVSAIKDMLYRIETGRNRPSGQNKIVNGFMNWFNSSVAATMFINVRSVVLQQMSLVNFINYSDNNILAAAKAFANQKQYWTDWATLFNSDFMKQRRGGIKTDVNGAELAESLKGAKNNPVVLLGKLLQLGFKPTQIGDNVAIATGGATYYRNRINTYLKQGLSQKEAEAKAFVDFQVLAEATQQSARPDMVSQQQASPLGKIILAFQNVTSQFNRLGKKAFLDIKNRRISPEYKNASNPQLQSDISNASRIAYYFVVQNLIFYTLQSALFMAMFDDDEDDKQLLRKKERVINGSIDSVLRGTGVWGAFIATLKNMAIKRFENQGKDWNANEYSVLAEGLQVSPPLGSRARKMVKAERELIWDKDAIKDMETFDIENPMWSAVTNYVEGTTNAPLNRTYNLTLQAKDGLDNQFTALQRILRVGGWGRWDLGIQDVEKEKKKQGFGDRKRSKSRTRSRSRTKSRRR